MERAIAKVICIELNPVHLKKDSKLPSSVFLAKAGTKNYRRTITKDLWYKIHPLLCCRFSVRRYLVLPRTTGATGTTGKSKNFSLTCA